MTETPFYIRHIGWPLTADGKISALGNRFTDTSAEEDALDNVDTAEESRPPEVYTSMKGADGLPLLPGSDVRWAHESGLWARGTVRKVNSAGHVELTDTSGRKMVRGPQELFTSPQPIPRMSPSNFQHVRSEKNGTSVFRNPANEDVWHVSAPQQHHVVATKVLAHILSRSAGVAVPQLAISPDGRQILTKHDKAFPSHDASARDFAVKAWLGKTTDGNSQDLHPGVPELTGVHREPWEPLSAADEHDGVRRVLAISPDEIHDAARTAGANRDVADKLIARRATLGETYNYTLPENTDLGRHILSTRQRVQSHPASHSVQDKTDLSSAIKKQGFFESILKTPHPGSAVWLRSKPPVSPGTPPHPDTWYVDSVSADRNHLNLRSGLGTTLRVRSSQVAPLKSNLRTNVSRYATGEMAHLGDRVKLGGLTGREQTLNLDPKHPEPHDAGSGVVHTLYPRFARVALDTGTHHLMPTSQLLHVQRRSQSAIPQAPRRGLYAKPYDGNTHQNDYIKQAESLIRAGDFKQKRVEMSTVIPTQSEEFTRTAGSGRGAKDLGPIVAKINGQDYLLDGHHRAYKSDAQRLSTQYVDLDKAGVTGGSDHKAVNDVRANRKGMPFDFENHDFDANPHPIGYSLTHRQPIAFLNRTAPPTGRARSDHMLGLLTDQTHPKSAVPVRIRTDNFRELSSVPADNTPKPVPNDIPEGQREGFRNPIVPSKSTIVQALAYTLPTSRASLDSGEQDAALLTARIMLGNRTTSGDGTVHGDAFLYQYTHNIGADSPVLRLSRREFARYLSENSTPAFHRGLSDPESTRDLRSGTWYGGSGLYGDGAYATDSRFTALNYGGYRAFNVVTFTPKKNAVVGVYDTLFTEMLQSMVQASVDRLHLMQHLDAAPPDSALSVHSVMHNPEIDSDTVDAFADIHDLLKPDGKDARIDERNQQLLGAAIGCAEFYSDKGLKIARVDSFVGRYSPAAAVKVHFVHGDDAAIRFGVRIVAVPVQDSAMETQETGYRLVFDFGAYRHTADIAGPLLKHHASPEHIQDFLRDLGILTIPLILFTGDGHSEAGAQKMVDVCSVNPDVFDILAITARMEFISDVGRYALATGVDYYTLPVGFHETSAVFTNRNAMVMQR